MRVLFAITAHGWGHLTRCAALMQALCDVDPSLALILSTALPEAELRAAVPVPFTYRRAEYEPGVRQHNCLDVDVPATAAAYRTFLAERPERLARERRDLHDLRVDLVVSDIAALPIRAAAAEGIRAVGLANFTWDWILAPLLARTPAADAPKQLAEDYASGECLFLLPFGQTTAPFPAITNAPVLARPAHRKPDETRARLGLEPNDGRPLALVCLGGWSGGDLPAIDVEPGLDLRFLVQRDLSIHFPSAPSLFDRSLPAGLTFPDLVRAADLVITKPGYGIASECFVQGTPVLFVDRSGFRETAPLFEQLGAIHPIRVLSRADFAAGRWNTAASELLTLPRPQPKPSGGTELARTMLAWM